jgi:hypothetical protein
MSSTARTLQITNGGAIALHNVMRGVKWYTEVTDLMNAGAFVKLLEKKLPALRNLTLIPEADRDTWMDKPLTIKVNQAILTTIKHCLEANAKQGVFMGTSHIMTVFQQVGISYTDHTDELLALNADETPA